MRMARNPRLSRFDSNSSYPAQLYSPFCLSIPSQLKSMRTNLNPAALIRSRSFSCSVTKWMFTPTPAGNTGSGISAPPPSRGSMANTTHALNFMGEHSEPRALVRHLEKEGSLRYEPQLAADY